MRDPSSLDRLSWVVPYQRCNLGYRSGGEEFHESWMRSQQTQCAATLLDEESPIHIDYMIRRIAGAWGIQRVGHKVDAAARQAISQAARHHGYQRHGDFYWSSDRPVTAVRRPVPGDPDTRREIHMIASPEIDLAFRHLIEGSPGASNEELLAFTARVLGFERMGERVRAVLERRLRAVRKSMP